MKIGVVTYWQSKDNYGQYLQCYAMQAYLKKLGHEPFLLRYAPTKPEIKVEIKSFKDLILYLPRYYRRKKMQNAVNEDIKRWTKEGGLIQRNFAEFLKNNIQCSSVFSREDLLKNPPIAKAYICGSDQIWGSNDLTYYLDFVPENTIRVAYAPSMGGITSLPEDLCKTLQPILKKFSFIGMREKSGVDVCQSLGLKDTVKVIDPTLLLTKYDYDKILTPQKKDKPYAFIYLLGNTTVCPTEKVMEYVSSKGLEPIYVVSQRRYDGYEKIFATLGEWLGYLSNADLVITNSFHCTVFSLIYNKPFITLALGDKFRRMNNRLEELLSDANLLSQFIFEDIESAPIDNLDFSSFRKYQQIEEQRSEHYLITSLK
ncbi:polysaccharide pyruvyl transferase family protein [Bacteroides sp.]|uniref:polysaccharide pyruvyl transferase family protein n=1 Tax=Bacteroides sp. TaxID=29523 RepID=UPI002A81C2F6|nr:polysaccharide pyruvyl transferase family protein [Bacteroides sp.]